jgi:hypothetical protein
VQVQLKVPLGAQSVVVVTLLDQQVWFEAAAALTVILAAIECETRDAFD